MFRRMSRLCYFYTMYDRDSHSGSLYGNERFGHSAENLLLCSTQERNYPFNQSLIWPSLPSEINAKMTWDVRYSTCIPYYLPVVFQSERIEKGQGTWERPEEPPHNVTLFSRLFLSVFLFQPETFYKRKKKIARTLQLLLLLYDWYFGY